MSDISAFSSDVSSRPPLPTDGPVRRPCSAIIILNWNGGSDTIECLQSLMGLTGASYRIIVCDNASTDRSVEDIYDWSAGVLQPTGRLHSSQTASKTDAKPGPARIIDRETAESGYYVDARLTIIKVGINAGFAGGNNVGLAYARRSGRFDSYWILNNDTVVHPEALAALQRRSIIDPEIGMIGSKLYWYSEPSVVQVTGGAAYDWKAARSRRLCDENRTVEEIESEIDHVAGASMFVTDAFLNYTGLMEERFFLYFEEMSWIVKSNGRFKLAYAPDSIVFHKEGSAIGSNSRHRPSNLSMTYIIRNRLLFTKLFRPKLMLALRCRLLWEAIVHLRRRDYFAFRLIFSTLARELLFHRGQRFLAGGKID